MKDLIIVGAGPAGLSAAIAAAKCGLEVTLIDEFMKPGGRLLGQLHEEPDGIWWNGIKEGQKLYDQILKLPISLLLETSVYYIEKSNHFWNIHTARGIFTSKCVLIATGAAEKASPLPGWTLPGVMSIGAAQVMTNVHQVKPGHRGIVIGINVLSLAIARELTLGGVDLVGLLLPPNNGLNEGQTSPETVLNDLLSLSNLAPSALMKIGGSLTKTFPFLKRLGIKFYPKNGMKAWNISLQLKRVVTEIVGDQQVEGVKVLDLTSKGTQVPGSERFIPVDFVCLAGGLSPLVELVGLTKCPFKYIHSLGGYIPVHNERMETPIEGLYVAGNITGIESSKVAMAQGTVAGLSISQQFNKLQDPSLLNQSIEHVHTIRRNALIQFDPNINDGRKWMNKIYTDYMADHGVTSPLPSIKSL